MGEAESAPVNSMRERILRAIPAIAGLLLFFLALEVLRRELHAVTWRTLSADALNTPTAQLLAAVLLTALNYSDKRQFLAAYIDDHVEEGNAARAAQHAHGFERGAAAKQQQHALAADVIGAKARVAGQRGKPEHLFVEACRTVEIIDVKTGLDHALELHTQFG